MLVKSKTLAGTIVRGKTRTLTPCRFSHSCEGMSLVFVGLWEGKNSMPTFVGMNKD